MIVLEYPGLVFILEYLAGEENSDVKHEFIGGLVFAVGGFSNQHNTIATTSLMSLGEQLCSKPCQVFNSSTKIRIEFPDHTRFYYPDAMVVCRSNSPTDHF